MPVSLGEIAGGITVDVTHRHVRVVTQQASHNFPPVPPQPQTSER